MLAGREKEKHGLFEALARASDEGCVAVLFGEAGVGKSHLAAWAASEARARGFTVLVGRCFSDGTAAFAPWKDALGAAAVGGKGPQARLDAAGEIARVFERVSADLARRLAEGPLLLLLEDLHWADPDSLVLFMHVTRFSLRPGVALFATVRTPDLDGENNEALDRVLAELVRSPACLRLHLRPFDEAGVAEHAAELVAAPIPQSLVHAIHAETLGNALYVRELVSHMIEEGKLVVREGRVSSDFSAGELGLPPSLKHVVRERLRRLPAQAAGLARVVAVANEPTEIAVLASALRVAEAETATALDALARAGLVRILGSRVEAVHAIVRRAIYEDAGKERAAVHRALAVSLEGSAGDPGAIAAHYHASRELEGRERGARWAATAARSARAQAAYSRASALYAMAIELAAADDPELPGYLFDRAVVAAQAGDASLAVATADRAARMLDERGRAGEIPELFADVARELAVGGVPRASWAGLVLRGLAAVGGRGRVWAHLMLLAREPRILVDGPVWIALFAGHDAEAVAILRAGEGKEGERDFAATVDYHEPRTIEASRELLARTRAWSEAQPIIRVRDAAARDLFFRGAFREAEREMEQVLAFSKDVGSVAGEMGALLLLGCTWAARGEIARARGASASAVELARRLGAVHRLGVIGPYAVEVAVAYASGGHHARDPAARRELTAASGALVAFVSSPGAASTPFGYVALNIGLLAAAFAGDEATADRLSPFQLRVQEALPRDVVEWGAGRDCGATAAWHLGRREHAARYLALAEADPARQDCAPWSSGEQSTARMAFLLGDMDRGRRWLDAARARFERDGRTACAAICDHDEALALVRARSPGGLTHLLDRAEQGFRAHGMDGWIEAVARLRAEAGVVVADPGEPARAPVASPLSPREREILALVARGLANKEIAKALFISVPTVERHLANVYAKIGVPNRAAATAYAIKHGIAGGAP